MADGQECRNIAVGGVAIDDGGRERAGSRESGIVDRRRRTLASTGGVERASKRNYSNVQRTGAEANAHDITIL
eukprot:scaffold83726_cov29-Tisochrysis_lutea.AAC.3